MMGNERARLNSTPASYTGAHEPFRHGASAPRNLPGSPGVRRGSRPGRARAGRAELAAMARSVEPRRFIGIGASDDMERDREPRVEGVARRIRNVVANRVGRPCVRDVTGGERRRGRRARIRSSPGTTERSPSGSSRLVAGARNRTGLMARSGSSWKRSAGLTACASGSIEPERPGRCPSSTRSTTLPRRRRRPTGSGCMPGSATARSWPSTWTDGWSGPGTWASSTRRSRRSGGMAARRRSTTIS